MEIRDETLCKVLKIWTNAARKSLLRKRQSFENLFAEGVKFWQHVFLNKISTKFQQNLSK